MNSSHSHLREDIPSAALEHTGTASVSPPQFKLEASDGSDQSVSSHAGTLQARAANGPIQRQAARQPIPAGQTFQTFAYHINVLEQAARAEGYGLNRFITALRKIWYDGMAFDLIVAGTRNIDWPEAWSSNATVAASRQWLKDNKTIPINGTMVDVSHLIAGLDARQNPNQINVGFASISRNQEAMTWAGDLGSVVGEYMRATNGTDISVHDVAARYNDRLGRIAWGYFSEPDRHSDADSYAMNLDTSLSLFSNLYNYYSVARDGQGVTRRYTNFAIRSGLMTPQGEMIEARVQEIWQTVYMAARMYLAGEGFSAQKKARAGRPHDSSYVIHAANSLQTEPGLFHNSIYDGYRNVSQWVSRQFAEHVVLRARMEMGLQ